MFGRNIRSKLPDKSVINEGMRDKDWGCKLTQKACVDNKRGAVPSIVLPGDQVLLKNTKTTGKLTPNFEQRKDMKLLSNPKMELSTRGTTHSSSPFAHLTRQNNNPRGCLYQEHRHL